MYWSSVAEFLAMGRHGVYVWGSVAVMALVMVAEPLFIVRGQKTLITRLKRQLRADRRESSVAAIAKHPSESQP